RIVRDDAIRLRDLPRRAGQERRLDARVDVVPELRHEPSADRRHARVVVLAPAVRVIELRIELAAGAVRRLEPAHGGEPAVEVVREALRVVAGEAVVREDEEAAASFARVAL